MNIDLFMAVPHLEKCPEMGITKLKRPNKKALKSL
jgi:hypothetical protein